MSNVIPPGASRLIPAGMSRDELGDLLLDMAQRVRHGDSFEGNLEYWLPDDEVDEPGWPSKNADYWVTGVYRVGNLDGQGGMRMIGTVPTP